MSNSLDGINVALVTPFDEEERVDEDGLAALVEDQIGHGMHGLVVNGSTGEFTSLTFEERRRNVEVVREAAGGRVPLIVHVGAMTTREAVAHAEHAADQGAICVMLVNPWYEALNEREIEEHLRAVASVGLPVMVYNNPGATGWSLDTDFIAQLAERVDGFRYLKDTTGDAGRLFRIQELCGDRLELLNGLDTLAFLGFLAGTRGTVWGAPNATPEACLKLWSLTVERPDLPAARELWSAFYPVNHFFESEGYMAAVKAGAQIRGLKVGPTRRPNLPLPPDRVRVLATLMERLDAAVGAVQT
ncbi:MAG: dihydrodipicolinate synthase family protein [Rubrobacter sp.]|nr:dihydrodipicolinate synthase family protein [Rubrobacter sp.]